MIEDMYLNDGIKNFFDVFVKRGMNDRSEAMNEGLIEIEELKQVVQKLEKEQKATKAAGRQFLKMGELIATKRKLLMMERQMMTMFNQKHMMMDKQKMKREQTQKMLMKMLSNTTVMTTTRKVDMVSGKNLK